MEFISAQYLHDGIRFLPENSCIVSEQGIITDVLDYLPNENVRFVDGLVCPGFINAHCHLELSYLKNLIPSTTGIVDFVLHINQLRHNFNNDVIQAAITDAENEMIANGIVAVGDICNSDWTVPQKLKKNLYYHNFIECVGVFDNNATERLAFYSDIVWQFMPLTPTHLTPHAPYSVSDTLFGLISDATANKILSIHNQESKAENELFLNASGDFLKLYSNLFGDTYKPSPFGITSLQHFLPLLHKFSRLILVHNTFSDANDIQFAAGLSNTIYWCTCPNANLYIENTLPQNYHLLLAANQTICIGTDSLASNTKLSIWNEITTLYNAYPEIGYESFIQWGTYNGAKALGIEDKWGSFKKGLMYKPFILEGFKTDMKF